MTNSTLCRLFAPSGSFLIGAVALVFGSFGASAQELSKTQEFSRGVVTSKTYVGTPGPGTNAATSGYFNENFTTPGVGAFGAADNNQSTTPNTIPFIFETQTFQAGSTANTLVFQLGQKGQNGFDSNNFIFVTISLNKGLVKTVLTVTGPNSAGNDRAPEFNIGIGGSNSDASYDSPKVVTMGLATPTEPGLNAIGTFSISLPNFAARTAVDVTIFVLAAKKSTVLIDNVSISSSRPLPVELTRFAATTKGQSVNVNWATASEKNSDRFEIQRSAIGKAFETVGTVKGQGNTSIAHNYSFVDNRPLAGRSYYRLRQVDTDGTTAYSPVAAVQVRNELAVYPNPSTGIVTLPATLGDVHYRLLNTIGQTLLSGQATGNDQLDLTKLAKGIFFLELTGEAGRTTQRLVRE